VLRSWRRVSRADRPDAYVYRILVNAFHDSRTRRWRGELPTADLPETPILEALSADQNIVRSV
jgi:DNA-directed RNA polymerase specialized sigma24 family protein